MHNTLTSRPMTLGLPFPWASAPSGFTAPLYHPPPNQDTLLLIITHCLEPLFCSLFGTPDWQQDLSLDDYNDLTFLQCHVFLQLSFAGKKLPACVDWDIIRESLSQVDARHWLPTHLAVIKELRFTKYDYLTPSPLSSNPSPQA